MAKPSRPNDYQRYLEIAEDKAEKPIRTKSDDYFTVSLPRYNTKSGEAEVPHVITVRLTELRGYYNELLTEIEKVKATYTSFGLDLDAIIAAEQAEPEGGEREII